MSQEDDDRVGRDVPRGNLLKNVDKAVEQQKTEVSSPVVIPATRPPQNTPSYGLTPSGTDGDFLLTAHQSNQRRSQGPRVEDVAAALGQLVVDRVGSEEGKEKEAGVSVEDCVNQLMQMHQEIELKRQLNYIERRLALESEFETLRVQQSVERHRIVEALNKALNSNNNTSNRIQGAGTYNFWQECIQNHPKLTTLVTEQDLGCLQHLVDIRSESLEMEEDAEEPRCGFRLEFDFSPNPYFENATLVKEYVLESTIIKLGKEAELTSSLGTEIQWKDGMDLSKKREVKRLRRKTKKGQVSRTVVNDVECDTFFSWFATPPSILDAESERDYEDRCGRIEVDFEIALLFLNELIPSAILYYTGEADDSDFDPEVFAEESEEEEEFDSGDDSDSVGVDFQNPFAPNSKPLPPGKEDCKHQ